MPYKYVCKTQQFAMIGSNCPIQFYDIPANPLRKEICVKAICVYASGITSSTGLSVYLSFDQRPTSSFKANDDDSPHDIVQTLFVFQRLCNETIFKNEENSTNECLKNSIHIALVPHDFAYNSVIILRISHYEKCEKIERKIKTLL